MVSLLVNSYANSVLMDGNLNNINSNIKKLFQVMIENKIHILNSVLSLRNNFYFKEKNVDILDSFPNTKQYKEVLENRGYQLTSMDKYIYENVNFILDKKEIPYYEKEDEPFIDTIVLNDKGLKQEYGFFIEQNYILFHSLIGNKVDFYYHLHGDYELIDFKIDKNNFVFIVYKHNGQTQFVITHLGLNFINLNRDNQEIKEESFFNKISIDPDVEEFIYTDYYKYYFLLKDGRKIEYTFGKKYYFEENKKFYFYSDESIEPYKDQIIDSTQVEFLNMYNYLNILGLNDFKIDGKFKISSQDDEVFKQLFANKFDNTLNGGLNYFNTKLYGKNKKISRNIPKLPDYRIYIDDEYFNIAGNFVYKNFEHGDFKIIVTKDTVSLYDSDNLCLKSCKFPSLKEFYFCNLKFMFKKFEFPVSNYTFTISCHDLYPFKQKQVDNFKLKTIPNNDKIIKNLINTSTIGNVDNRIINGKFDGNKIIFYNFFDFKNKKYKYNDKKILTKPNLKISKKEIKQYYFNKSTVEKNEYIYFRDYGEFHYTNVNDICFELVNSKGFITDFWIQNQGKTIYFKNTEGNITIVNKNENADYYCYIPPISEFIVESKDSYGDVELEENDDLEIEKEYSSEMLITNKFFNKPLFYKFFIPHVEDIDTFTLYDENRNEVYEYMSETFQDGVVIYFDAKNNSKYFYNVDDTKNNYINPIKSYENIEIVHYFDENGTIDFPEREIKSFYLKGTINKETISIYLYNTTKGDAYHLTLSKEELNKRFELDLCINKIVIDNQYANVEELSFVEDSANSLKGNNTITFFKTKREDIVYLSNLNKPIDLNKVDFSSMQVNVKYSYSNNKMIRSNNGNFKINCPLPNAIALFYYDKFTHYEVPMFFTYSISDDEYYNNNFKNIGVFHITGNDNYRKLSETTNEIFEINQTNNEVTKIIE